MKTTFPWRWRPGSSHPTNEIFLRPKQLQTEDNILPVFNIIVYRSLRRCYYTITCKRDGTGKSHRVGRLKGTVGRRPARERTWSNHLMYPNTGDWSAKYLPCHLPSTICKHATPLHLRNYYDGAYATTVHQLVLSSDQLVSAAKKALTRETGDLRLR